MVRINDELKSYIKEVPLLGALVRQLYLFLFSAGGVTDHLQYLRYSVLGDGWLTVNIDGQEQEFRCSTVRETRRATVAVQSERLVIEMLRDLCKPGMVVFDIGANVGTHGLAIADVVGPEGRVVCFEPHSKTYDALTHNIERNDLDNVHAENEALGPETGEADLYVERDEPGVGSHSLRRRSTDLETTETVQMRKGDEYVTASTFVPDLLKIDVEGAEISVLEGLEETLQTAHPIVVVEVHDVADGKAIRDLLLRYGYDLRQSPVDKEVLIAT